MSDHVKPIKVIDLFAGPGGLGEGFTAFRTQSGQRPFKIALSIEKEASAHRTLTLRSLFRQFSPEDVPESYYAFMRGELGGSPEDELYKLPELKDAYESASREAAQLELGKNYQKVYRAISEALKGDECILLGGPPCQAYSLVGRARNFGGSGSYDADADNRNFLYVEYLRIIARFQPMAFVMENVKGLLSAKTAAGPVFDRILSDLKDPCKSVSTKLEAGRSRHRYRIFSFVKGSQTGDLFSAGSLMPQDYVIKSELYGIPQARHRVILLGLREDLISEVEPQTLLPCEKSYSVSEAINDLPAVRSGLSKQEDIQSEWAKIPVNLIKELKNNDQISKELWRELEKASTKTQNLDRGAEFGLTSTNLIAGTLREWYQDPRLGKYITNHTTRGHMAEDIARYWFASVFAQNDKKQSPRLADFPEELLPKHKNVGEKIFTDRFRVQLAGRPSTTITSHISKDGHYFIHPDPKQMRSLTVREAARLQTFPDNYHFVGNRTEQYVQVGNAVPPKLAIQLASALEGIIS